MARAMHRTRIHLDSSWLTGGLIVLVAVRSTSTKYCVDFECVLVVTEVRVVPIVGKFASHSPQTQANRNRAEGLCFVDSCHCIE